MNISLMFLIFLCIFMSVSEYLITKKIFTPSTILGWPFVCIILLNNTLGVKLGFFSINNHTINQIALGVAFFSIGSLAINLIKLKSKKKSFKIVSYNINNIAIYVSIIAIITLIRLIIYIKRYGLNNFIANDGMNGILMTGVFCHFLLSTYPLIPILISYSFKKRCKRYSIAPIAIIILVYFTFVKYHIISLILIIIIYLNIENPKRLKKTIPVLVIIPIGIFFLNYVANFKARGIQAQSGYLLKHLINYLDGGLIYNSVYPDFTYNNFGLVQIIIMIVMALPNLFLNVLFNIKVYQFNQIPFMNMGFNGEIGNVLNTISFVFSSKNIIGSCVLFFTIGAIISSINVYSNKRYPLISVIYTFVFLTFYATFLVLTPPWEMILFAIIMPSLFIKKEGR